MNFDNISKFRFWSGIIVYLLYAFILFNFFILLFEFVTIAKDGFNFNLKSFITYQEYKFYLFFVAFYTISYVVYLLIDFWYNKPENTLKAKKQRRFVSYERKAFHNGTLLWLFRLSVFTLIFKYGSVIQCLDLYTNYKFVFVLLALVIFLDLSIGFRRAFKLSSIQLFYSFLSIVLLSFAFTFFRPYNDKAMTNFINRGLNERDIELPYIESIYNTKKIRNKDQIYFTADKKLYIGNNKLIDEKELKHYLRTYDFSYQNQGISLFIDKSTTMKEFNKIKLEMMRQDRLKANIVVNNSTSNCQDYPVGINVGFPHYSFYAAIDSFENRPPPPINVYEIADSNLILIHIEANKIRFNDSMINLIDLEKLVFENVKKDKVIRLNYLPHTSFQNYLEVIVVIKKAVYRKRDSLSKKATELNFLELREIVYSDIESTKKAKWKEIYYNIKENAPLWVDENFLESLY